VKTMAPLFRKMCTYMSFMCYFKEPVDSLKTIHEPTEFNTCKIHSKAVFSTSSLFLVQLLLILCLCSLPTSKFSSSQHH
jgi:hypothetical protein